MKKRITTFIGLFCISLTFITGVARLHGGQHQFNQSLEPLSAALQSFFTPISLSAPCAWVNCPAQLRKERSCPQYNMISCISWVGFLIFRARLNAPVSNASCSKPAGRACMKCWFVAMIHLWCFLVCLQTYLETPHSFFQALSCACSLSWRVWGRHPIRANLSY